MIFFTLLRREFPQLVRSGHGIVPIFLSLAGANALLVSFLMKAEGTTETLPSLWGLAVAFGLPFLAAVAASRGFTQDRENGMLRLMFSTPVRARWWVLGKVGAAWMLCLFYLLGMATSCYVLLRWLLPEDAQLSYSWTGFLFAGGALMLQALLWCSLGTFVSLFSRSSASTFLFALVSCLFAPPLVVFALTTLTTGSMTQWPWFPLQTMVYDCASGLIDVRLAVGCLTGSLVLIYASGMVFDALRLCATER
ncbi:MAG: ABC transporter permease subunit [Kiritimatiellae bacterium]|jgi:ABC-type transport system involved in multi-copper enzyme maturation permease subunit|nr:ABC transporter permease subunit [Kiritimatiellia bacterium]